MINRIYRIKKVVRQECEKNCFKWFYEIHLLGVERFAKKLLKNLPKANKEIVMLGVWLHDLQRIRRLRGNHAEIGAKEAKKVMKELGYEGGGAKAG